MGTETVRRTATVIHPDHLFAFRDIKNMHDLNRFANLKRREPELKRALTIYAATIGCIYHEGKYWTVYEYNPASGEIGIAKLRTEGYISINSVISKPGHRYIAAWDERQAKQLLGV